MGVTTELCDEIVKESKEKINNVSRGEVGNHNATKDISPENVSKQHAGISPIPNQLKDKKFRFVKLNGKRAIGLKWQINNNYSYDDPVLLNHRNKGGNYGILCGELSGDLLVIDFDTEDFQNKYASKFPQTFTVRSGGGLKHMYFICKNAVATSIKDDEENTLTDILYTGKQAVTVGSIHNKTGKPYTVVDDSPIKEIDFVEVKKIFYEHLVLQKVKKSNKHSIIKDKVIESIRSKVSLPNLLEHYNMDTTKNPTKCLWHDSKGGQCFSFNNEVFNCFHCSQKGDIFSFVMKQENCNFPQAKEKLAQIAGIELNNDDDFDIYTYDRYHNRKLCLNKVVTKLKRSFSFITIGEERGTIHYYTDGYFKAKGKGFISKTVQDWTDGELTNNQIKEILGKIKRGTYHDELPQPDIKFLCVGNGVLNIETLELTEHTPEIPFFQKINSDYEPNADFNPIQERFDEIIDRQQQLTLQEFFGFCLYKKYVFKKAGIFYGPRDSGKTTILYMLNEMIGKTNISAISLHKLTVDKFSASALQHKLVNLYDDLDFRDIKATGAFKIACGGGYLSAEKKFGENFQFENYAKLIFATNKISAVQDSDDDAYYSRWLIFFFNNIFDKNNSKTDMNMKFKLTVPKYRSALLNWSLKGLHRLLENGKFTYNYTPEQNKLFMEKSSNTISGFCQDWIVQADGYWISSEDFYMLYSKYTEINGGARMSKDKFTKDIPKKLSYVVASKKTCKDKKGVRGFINVGINPDVAFDTFFQNIYSTNIYDNIPNNDIHITWYKNPLYIKKGVKGDPFKVNEEIIEEKPKETVGYDFYLGIIRNAGKEGYSIDDFCTYYSEKIMNEMLRDGLIIQIEGHKVRCLE